MADPIRLDPFQNITGVGWGDCKSEGMLTVVFARDPANPDLEMLLKGYIRKGAYPGYPDFTQGYFRDNGNPEKDGQLFCYSVDRLLLTVNALDPTEKYFIYSPPVDTITDPSRFEGKGILFESIGHVAAFSDGLALGNNAYMWVNYINGQTWVDDLEASWYDGMVTRIAGVDA